MKTSESLNELATALSKAQGELKDANQDATNPHFRSSYATLDTVLKNIRPIFSKHGLSIIQIPVSEGDKHFLMTRILHQSGQWIEGSMELLLFKKDMQGMGAAITYARRYSAGAFAGIGSETDDDANSISETQSAKPYQAPKPIAKPAAPVVVPVDPFKETLTSPAPKLKNEAPVGGQEVANLVMALERKGKSKDKLCKHYDVQELGYLKIWQYAEAMEMLNG